MPLHKAMEMPPTWERQGAKRKGFWRTRNPCRLMEVRRGGEFQALKLPYILPLLGESPLRGFSHAQQGFGCQC